MSNGREYQKTGRVRHRHSAERQILHGATRHSDDEYRARHGVGVYRGLMKRRWAFAVGVLVSSTSYVACTEYQASSPAADDGGARDAATDANTPLGDGSTFVPEQVPTWSPAWVGDATLGEDISLSMQESCPALPSVGGALQGTWKYASGCLSKTVFAASFEQFCPGMQVHGNKAVARINGRVVVADDHSTVLRTGTLWMAAELLMPCRQTLAQNDCNKLAGLITAGIKAGHKDAVTIVSCYDTAIDTCTCQMDDVGPIDSKARRIDSSAGKWGDKFSYAITSNQLFYVGVGGSFSLDAAMVWTLIPE